MTHRKEQTMTQELPESIQRALKTKQVVVKFTGQVTFLVSKEELSATLDETRSQLLFKLETRLNEKNYIRIYLHMDEQQ